MAYHGINAPIRQSVWNANAEKGERRPVAAERRTTWDTRKLHHLLIYYLFIYTMGHHLFIYYLFIYTMGHKEAAKIKTECEELAAKAIKPRNHRQSLNQEEC